MTRIPQITSLDRYLLKRALAEPREMGSNGGSSDSISPSNDFGSCFEGKCIKRTTQDITSGMWFGPRLGKRHRSDEKQEVSPEIEVLANALNGVRWAVIPISGEILNFLRTIRRLSILFLYIIPLARAIIFFFYHS